MLIMYSEVYHHCETLVHLISPTLFSSYIQLKTDILDKAIFSIPPSASDSTNSSANEASSASDDHLIQTTNANDIMLEDLLKSIVYDTADDSYMLIMIRRVILQRVNARMNSTNCSLEMSSR